MLEETQKHSWRTHFDYKEQKMISRIKAIIKSMTNISHTSGLEFDEVKLRMNTLLIEKNAFTLSSIHRYIKYNFKDIVTSMKSAWNKYIKKYCKGLGFKNIKNEKKTQKIIKRKLHEIEN